MDTTCAVVLILLLNLCAVIGNATVFVWRCRKGNNERCSILSMMIVHLAFFDFICGAHCVTNGGLTLANVFNATNGTISVTAYETYKRTMSYPLAVYFASLYTSNWMTLFIAIYSLAVISPWKRRTIRIIAGVSFLVAWMTFASSLAANGYMIHMSTAATVHPGNKTYTIEAAFWSLYSTPEIRYLFVCECLSAGFVIITGGLYLLVVLPRVKKWKNMNRSYGEQSFTKNFSRLRGRLLAVVCVNFLCTLGLIAFMGSCRALIVDYSFKNAPSLQRMLN